MTDHIATARLHQGEVDGPRAWLRMAICMVLGTIGSIGMWAVVVVLPAVQAEFGVDRGTASMPYTTTMIGFAVGNVVLGRYVDRWGIMWPTIGAAIALGLGFILAGVSSDIWQFAAVQGFLIGVGNAAGFGPLIANISHWFKRRLGIAVAAVASGNYIAGAIWPPVLTAFIEADGWRTTYVIAGIFCIATMIPLAYLLRRPMPVDTTRQSAGSSPQAADVQPISLSPRALQALLVMAGLACCVAMSMPQVHVVAYCVDLGYGVARGAEMLSLMLAGGIVSRLASGFLADYIGGIRTLLLGSVLQGLSLLLFIPFDGLMSLYIVSLIFGLSQGGIVPSYAVIVREYLPAREAGQRVGIVIMSTIIGMALGGWLSGWIYDLTGSYEKAFLNGIVWNLLNLSVMLFVLWRTRGPAAAATA